MIHHVQAPNPQQIVLLLLIGAIVSIIARRFRLPSASGLILAGFALAFLNADRADIGLTQQVLFVALLPALVFESALNLRFTELRKDWLPLLTLVTFGVVVNLLVVALIMRYLVHWPWLTSLTLGALTAATDPIAVLSTFKEANLGGRPRMLAEAESLLNDGVAVVAYGLVAISAEVTTTSQLVSAAGQNFAITVAGGIAIGCLVGLIMTLISNSSDDPLEETTLTTVGAYGAYYAAHYFGGSGILATVASGLVMGNIATSRNRFLTEGGRRTAEALWEFAAFAANALVFLLMGFTLAHVDLRAAIIPIIVAIVGAFIARSVAVYTSCGLVSATARKVPSQLQHLLVVGGQRGALSLVLAIAVPTTMPLRDDLIAATAGVVVFSILIQGLIFRPLLDRLRTTSPETIWA